MPRKVRSDGLTTNGDEDGSRLLAQARMLGRLCFRWQNAAQGGTVLRSLALYPPSATRNGAWMVVCKVWDDGTRKVGFHRSTDPLTALLGALSKWADGTLALRADTFEERWNDGKR